MVLHIFISFHLTGATRFYRSEKDNTVEIIMMFFMFSTHNVNT